MQVLLSADVKGVGKKGEVVSVKPAYAENMLIRSGLGQEATPEILEQLAADNEAAIAAAIAEKEAAQENEKALTAAFGEEGAVLKKKVGPDGSMFGSITPTEIADLIKKRVGLDVPK